MSAGGANATDFVAVNPLLDRREAYVKLYGGVARFEQLFGLRRLELAAFLHLGSNRIAAEGDGSNNRVGKNAVPSLRDSLRFSHSPRAYALG